MRKHFYTALAAAWLLSGIMAMPAHAKKKKKNIYKIFDEMPEYPGGQDSLLQYISRSVRYPDSALYYQREALVKVTFRVNDEGFVDSVLTKEEFGYGFNTEAIRVVKNMPQWKPGRNEGKPVKVWFQIPIRFTLDKDSKAHITN